MLRAPGPHTGKSCPKLRVQCNSNTCPQSSGTTVQAQNVTEQSGNNPCCAIVPLDCQKICCSIAACLALLITLRILNLLQAMLLTASRVIATSKNDGCRRPQYDNQCSSTGYRSTGYRNKRQQGWWQLQQFSKTSIESSHEGHSKCNAMSKLCRQ